VSERLARDCLYPAGELDLLVLPVQEIALLLAVGSFRGLATYHIYIPSFGAPFVLASQMLLHSH